MSYLVSVTGLVCEAVCYGATLFLRILPQHFMTLMLSYLIDSIETVTEKNQYRSSVPLKLSQKKKISIEAVLTISYGRILTRYRFSWSSLGLLLQR